MENIKILPFTKMHGAGNDYVYVNELSGKDRVDIPEKDIPDIAKKVSNRHFGVGSDGLIIISPSTDADFRMRIFNADGSEAQMCGNGIRCVGKYLYDKGFISQPECSVLTKAGIKYLRLNIEGGKVNSVTVDMGRAYLLREEVPVKGHGKTSMIDEPIELDNHVYNITAIGMGNPHGVIIVNNIENIDPESIGKKLENLDIWPEKANIEFVEVLDQHNIRMRVWERGSGITLACGTGACASVVATNLLNLTADIVNVKVDGGYLKIKYDSKDNSVEMTGPCETVCDGIFYYKTKI